MTMHQKHQVKHFDLDILSREIIDQISTILNSFNIQHTEYENRIQGCCPIHNGDNPNGFSILTDGVGNWKCFTQGCETQYDSSIIGLIEALLSKEYDRVVSRKEAIEWCARLVGMVGSTPENISESMEKTQFINLYKYIHPDKTYTNNFVPRQTVKQSLTIPAPQYIGLYSKAILIQYDIGLCNNPKKSMYNRIVVPLYDDTGQFMLGCSGRSIFPRCSKCKNYHNINLRCPIDKQEKIQSVKWKLSSKFNADCYLYNLWQAYQYITETNFVILVEGPGDVWRLEEAGIHNSVALLGTKFTDEQCEILEKTGALDIIIATDNDDAGTKARNRIASRCNRIFNIHHIYPPNNDIGEMPIQEVKMLFNSLIDIVKEKCCV